MVSPAGCYVLRRGKIESPLVSEIVRNRDRVRLSRLGEITCTGAIEATRRKDPNSHLEKALPRSLTAVTGRSGYGGFASIRFHGAPLPRAVDYKTGIELYQSIDL